LIRVHKEISYIRVKKESGFKGPAFAQATARQALALGSVKERLKVQGTGHKAKIIRENLFSPYALRLTPCALNIFCW
jgi:hypothetical protein